MADEVLGDIDAQIRCPIELVIDRIQVQTPNVALLARNDRLKIRPIEIRTHDQARARTWRPLREVDLPGNKVQRQPTWIVKPGDQGFPATPIQIGSVNCVTIAVVDTTLCGPVHFPSGDVKFYLPYSTITAHQSCLSRTVYANPSNAGIIVTRISTVCEKDAARGVIDSNPPRRRRNAACHRRNSRRQSITDLDRAVSTVCPINDPRL